MKQNNQEWLPHLTSEVVADSRGWNLDAYVIALEGWRRGLTLKWHDKESEKFNEIETWFVDTPGRLFSLTYKDRTHYFFRSRGDKVTNEAVNIGGNKDKSKQALAKAGIQIPEGKRFNSNISDEGIVAYGEKIGFPVVLKPTDGSFGRGVITNIKNKLELETALRNVRQEQGYSDVIVEQFITGEDYRVYVVGDKAVAVMRRIPANIIGDGFSTVRELIHQKNEKRKQNPRLISCLINISEEMVSFIESSGYTLDTVLEDGKQLFLTDKSNISIGGDPINITEKASKEVLDIGVKALQSVPGLKHGSVDLIVNSQKNTGNAATVIELNPTSQIGGLLFPEKGNPSDVPAAIIDYYFPETKRSPRSLLYFDFNEVLMPLKNGTAMNTVVTPIEVEEKLFGKKYIVYGDVGNYRFHRWLRVKALQNNLYGRINIKCNFIEVIVSGPDLDTVENFKTIIEQENNRAEVVRVSEEKWNKPIKLGFEIEGTRQNLMEEVSNLNKSIELSKIEYKKLEKQYEDMLNSRLWRFTLPIRKFTGTIKTFFRLLKGDL